MVNLIHLILFANIQHYFDKRNKKGHKRLVAVSDEKKLAPRKGKTTQDTDAYYVFNRENDEGFIIVSGDDKTIPVLGYCDKGSFDYQQIPETLQKGIYIINGKKVVRNEL